MDEQADLCEVGDVVYHLTKTGITPITITAIDHYPHSVYRGEDKHQSYFNRSFGRVIFKTKEEAEEEQWRRERIQEKKQRLKEYEELLNEKLRLEGHFIVK
jgi:cell shape-determining protein MreC